MQIVVGTLCTRLLRWSFLTSSKVTQLSTNHSSINAFPGVVTHSTPHIVHTDFNPAFTCTGTSYQLQLTGCARSYMQQESIGLQLINNRILWLHTLPSQPTPASWKWLQSWDRIGLLEHSSNWRELDVHWTSSRKIGPLPAPKCALLYALPPIHIQVQYSIQR